jgi:hypothetical protein
MHFEVTDPKARNVTCRFVLRGDGDAIPCLPAGSILCRFNTTLEETGSYILEIYANSKQVAPDDRRRTKAEDCIARLQAAECWGGGRSCPHQRVRCVRVACMLSAQRWQSSRPRS